MNYYEVLGVTPDSEISDIKSAYHKLARKFHPDINPNGIKKFKEISNAYNTLSDNEKRKQYDILNGIFRKNINREKFNDDFREKCENVSNKENKNKKETVKNKKGSVQNKKITNDKYYKFKNFIDLLNKQFLTKKKYIKQPINGKNINADVNLSSFEAVYGTSKVVNILIRERCPRCNGRKFINGAKCEVCNGTGEYSQYKKITVKIPPNVKNSSILRVKSEGHEGKFGGKNGDLLILIHITDNENIKYDGNNILYNISISPYDAVLGCEVVVFNDIKFKIPPKTTTGQKFRLSGLGVNNNGKNGDLIVTVGIEIPKDLSDDEIRMYEKIKRMSKYQINYD